MAKVIAVHNIKGGVGKTTLAVNLAGVSAIASGRKTLLWDLDAQGSASFLCATSKANGNAREIFARTLSPGALIAPTNWPKLDILGADPSLRSLEKLLLDVGKPKRLKKILQDLVPLYDYIILDCPPGLNEVSDQVFKASDLVLVPVVPTPLGLRGLEQMEAYLSKQPGKLPRLFPLVSMADTRKALHRTFVADHADWPIIPQASIVEQMTVKLAPIEAFAPRSSAAFNYRAIWQAVETLMSTAAQNEQKTNKRGRPRIPKARV
ncbi:MAG: ParA family protein [Chakrabartia sp.]